MDLELGAATSNIEISVIHSEVKVDGDLNALVDSTHLPSLFLQPVAPVCHLKPVQAERAIQQTLTDPMFQQFLQQSETKKQFNAQQEQQKLRQFLGSNHQKQQQQQQEAGKWLMPRRQAPVNQVNHNHNHNSNPSSARHLLQCAKCTNFLDPILYDKHNCGGIPHNNQSIEPKAIEPPSSIISEKPMRPQVPPRKSKSDRVIQENQIRIRRYLKEELKYDLPPDTEQDKNSGKGPNECSICDRKFVHASGLVRHMEKHALDLIPTQIGAPSGKIASQHTMHVVIQCKPCGRVFSECEMALDHLHTHYPLSSSSSSSEQKLEQSHQSNPNNNNNNNNNNNMSECKLSDLLKNVKQFFPTEGFETTSNSNSNNYFVTLILNTVLQCEFCDYIFADIAHLLAHSAVHVPERRFECTACDIRMSTSKEASLHYQTDCIYLRESKLRNSFVNRQFVCNVCELKFNNQEMLQEHRYSCYHFFPRLNITRDRLLLPCEFCEVNFEAAHEIQAHYEEKHLNKKRREKDARSMNCSASGRLRQYLCDICGKSYTQSSHLWQHLRFHQGVKPFVCQEEGCGRKFTIRPDLNDHIRKCHTGERPYHCLVCGKRFLTGSVFYQHRLIHRGERRYECEECGKRFYRADALKNHQRIHTGEKPYSCLFCTKTFRQRGDRDKHIRARHSHLDENARLMMQMQKFQLESAAAAAAMKSKNVQQLPDSDSMASLTTSEAQPGAKFIELMSNDYEMDDVVVPELINNNDDILMFDDQDLMTITDKSYDVDETGNSTTQIILDSNSTPLYYS